MYGKTSQKKIETEINDGNGNDKDKKKVEEKKIIIPYHLKKIATMCASESLKDLILLFQYFELTFVREGGVLWKVGDASSSAILLCKGGLISHSLSERELDENKDKNEFSNDRYINGNNNNDNFQNNGNVSGSVKERYAVKIDDEEIAKEEGREGGREREDDEEHGEDFEEIYIGHLIGKKTLACLVYACVEVFLCDMHKWVSVREGVFCQECVACVSV